jgi:hypothetical protein
MLSRRVSTKTGGNEVLKISSILLKKWIITDVLKGIGTEYTAVTMNSNTSVVYNGTEQLLFSETANEQDNYIQLSGPNGFQNSVASVTAQVYAKVSIFNGVTFDTRMYNTTLKTNNTVSTANGTSYKLVTSPVMYLGQPVVRNYFKMNSDINNYIQIVVRYVDDSVDTFTIKGSTGATYIPVPPFSNLTKAISLSVTEHIGIQSYDLGVVSPNAPLVIPTSNAQRLYANSSNNYYLTLTLNGALAQEIKQITTRGYFNYHQEFAADGQMTDVKFSSSNPGVLTYNTYLIGMFGYNDYIMINDSPENYLEVTAVYVDDSIQTFIIEGSAGASYKENDPRFKATYADIGAISYAFEYVKHYDTKQTYFEPVWSERSINARVNPYSPVVYRNLYEQGKIYADPTRAILRYDIKGATYADIQGVSLKGYCRVFLNDGQVSIMDRVTFNVDTSDGMDRPKFTFNPVSSPKDYFWINNDDMNYLELTIMYVDGTTQSMVLKGSLDAQYL